MTRSILAIGISLLAASTLLASAAQAACIACEYVPEVVRGSRTSDPPAYSREYSHVYVRERAYAVEREHRGAPVKRFVKRDTEAADTTPVKTQAENENSSISLSAEAATAKTEKADPKPVERENSSIALASTADPATRKTAIADTAKEAAFKPGDCKKFFPSVGLTLTVPCE